MPRTLSCNGFLKSRRFLLHDEHKLDKVWGLHSKDTLLLSAVQATELKFSVSWFGGLDLYIKDCVSLKLWWRFCSKSLWSEWMKHNTKYICNNFSIFLQLSISVYLSIWFCNSCHCLPETKRHSSLFLHWYGSKFLVVRATCTTSIHILLDILFFFSSAFHI
jgi:hypothetical protein